jgi:hypothetical protein
MNQLMMKLMGRLYRDQAGDSEGGGGGDSAAAEKAAPEASAKAEEEKKESAKKPSDEEARLLKENMKKKEDLKKATEELVKAQTRLKEFDGIDPEAIKKLLAERSAAETKSLEDKGEWDRLKQRMAEEHAKDGETLRTEIKALKEKLGNTEGTIKELSIGSMFSQSNFIAEELTLTPSKARVIYGEFFDLEDGTVVGYDKPRGAQGRTAIVDQFGTPVGFNDAMRKIVEADPEKDHLMKSKMKPGAGSESKQTGKQSSKSQPVDSISKISSGLKGLKIV